MANVLAGQNRVRLHTRPSIGRVDQFEPTVGLMHQEAAAGGADHLDRLAEIRAPTLVIHGDADVPVPLEQGQALAAGIPGARLVVLPGVGHRSWVERPEPTIWAILSFLSAAGTPAPAS